MRRRCLKAQRHFPTGQHASCASLFDHKSSRLLVNVHGAGLFPPGRENQGHLFAQHAGAAAQLFHSAAGDEPLHLYLLLVAASVGLSAFIDNIPYVAAMLPVVQGVAALMNGGAGIEPELFYFGLLTGATLGGNLTPIGASANIAAIGILRKNGETVRTWDFLRIGVPFTLAAVLVGAGSLWLFWGI